jgi:hypothetical protein
MNVNSTQLLFHYLDCGWLYVPFEEQEETVLEYNIEGGAVSGHPVETNGSLAQKAPLKDRPVSRDWWFVVEDLDLSPHQIMLEKMAVALGCRDSVRFIPAPELESYQTQNFERPLALLLFGAKALQVAHNSQETIGSFFMTSTMVRPGLFLPSLTNISAIPEKKIGAWRSMQGFKSHLESIS